MPLPAKQPRRAGGAGWGSGRCFQRWHRGIAIGSGAQPVTCSPRTQQRSAGKPAARGEHRCVRTPAAKCQLPRQSTAPPRARHSLSVATATQCWPRFAGALDGVGRSPRNTSGRIPKHFTVHIAFGRAPCAPCAPQAASDVNAAVHRTSLKRVMTILRGRRPPARPQTEHSPGVAACQFRAARGLSRRSTYTCTSRERLSFTRCTRVGCP